MGRSRYEKHGPSAKWTKDDRQAVTESTINWRMSPTLPQYRRAHPIIVFTRPSKFPSICGSPTDMLFFMLTSVDFLPDSRRSVSALSTSTEINVSISRRSSSATPPREQDDQDASCNKTLAAETTKYLMWALDLPRLFLTV